MIQSGLATVQLLAGMVVLVATWASAPVVASRHALAPVVVVLLVVLEEEVLVAAAAGAAHRIRLGALAAVPSFDEFLFFLVSHIHTHTLSLSLLFFFFFLSFSFASNQKKKAKKKWSPLFFFSFFLKNKFLSCSPSVVEYATKKWSFVWRQRIWNGREKAPARGGEIDYVFLNVSRFPFLYFFFSFSPFSPLKIPPYPCSFFYLLWIYLSPQEKEEKEGKERGGEREGSGKQS
jgi:hypothetical protein